MYIVSVIVVNSYKECTTWNSIYRTNAYHMEGNNGTDVEISFPERPRFFEQTTPSGIHCGQVANLYGGSSLAFFTPATCYYFNNGHECRFCSLKPNRDAQQMFINAVSPALAASVLEVAL